ncbi:ketohexokinase isoform X2 [Hydra vulgaris]|uniref:Ketohexokinase isoform X2 n=1 Tax=Hydra vulgaris TaxID=6087 RepID=A0ABM4B5B5_HYDVU
MRKRILVVGLTCIDVVNVCNKFPIEDEDLKVSSQYWAKGGNAANTACVLAQNPNIDVHLFSYLSYQPENEFVIRHLKECDINLESCPITFDKKFPMSCCILNETNGSRTILHYNNDFPSVKFEDFLKLDILSYDWIHFEGRNLVEVSKMIAHIRQILFKQKFPKHIIISGEMEKFSRLIELEKYLLPNVDILFIGKEIGLGKGFKSSEETITHYSSKKHSKPEIFICPWGETGAFASKYVSSSGSVLYFKSDSIVCKNIVDTLGAGDTFIAGTISKFICNEELDAAIKYGCLVAGLKCTQYGFDDLFLKAGSH